MRRLILFRHAKAEPRGAAQGDIDRPLAPRGRADAALMGRLAADRGLTPDLALVSPSLRTRQTWLLASPAFPGAMSEIRRGLYDATPEELMAEVERVHAATETVMVVGHNPGLHELAAGLLADGAGSAAEVERVCARFPTAAIAAFLIDAAGRPSFDGLYFPRDAGGEG